MDRAINRIFIVGTILMIALMGNLVWLQVLPRRERCSTRPRTTA